MHHVVHQHYFVSDCLACKRCSKNAAQSATLCLSSSSNLRASSSMSFLRMSSGGMQLTSSSYSLPLTANRRLGVCSARMSLAISCMARPRQMRSCKVAVQTGHVYTSSLMLFCTGKSYYLLSCQLHTNRFAQLAIHPAQLSASCGRTVQLLRPHMQQHAVSRSAGRPQVVSNLNIKLPICHLHWLIICKWVLGHFAGLKTQQCTPQIPLRDLSDAVTQRVWQLQAFFPRYIGQHVLNLRVGGCCHTYAQASASHWLNHLFTRSVPLID